MREAERVDLTGLTRAMVRSSNLSVGLFVFFFLFYIVLVPLAVAIPNYGQRAPSLIDLAVITGPASIALMLLYPAAYFLVCVWRIAVVTELVALGFGYMITAPFTLAVPTYFQYSYKAQRVTPEAYWEAVFPGFWGNATILSAIEQSWLASLAIGAILAYPFVRAAWRFKRARSRLAKHGIRLANQPWRRPAFRSQMQALSWSRSLFAVVLFWGGFMALQTVPAAALGAFGNDAYLRYVASLSVIVCSVLLLRAGHRQMLAVRRKSMLKVGEILAADERAPVLFLRSFSDDHIQLRSRRKPMLWPLATRRMGAEDTFEEALTMVVTEIGPVIAIGRPGETTARVGAAREYVSDDAWQERVNELIYQAALIVVLIGNTQGLAWEAARLLSPSSRDKVLFVVPPTTNAIAQERWQSMRQRIAEEGGEVSELPLSVENVLAWTSGRAGTRVYCASSRSQDTYELGVLLAGHEVKHGRLPIETVCAAIG